MLKSLSGIYWPYNRLYTLYFLKCDAVIACGFLLLPYPCLYNGDRYCLPANIRKKETGRDMLISLRILLLTGFCLCGPMWFSL